MLVQLDWRERYTGPIVAISELVAIGLSLLIYFYTAKAFEQTMGGDYFTYVLIGELALLLPLQIVESMSRHLKRMAVQGSFDAFVALPTRPQTAPLLLGLAGLPRDAARVFLTLTIAKFFFGAHVEFPRLLFAAVLQLIALPAFLGIGMLASAAMLGFGRGQGVFLYLATGASVLAGAYFPVSVLPESLRVFGQNFSPFTLLLENTRWILSGSQVDKMGFFLACMTLLKWGLILGVSGYAGLGLSLRILRRRGNPLFF